MLASGILALPLLLPLMTIHAFEQRANRGRPGSILVESDQARVWFVCLVLVALVTLISGMTSSVTTPLVLLLLAIVGAGLAAIAVHDFRLASRVRQARSGAEPSAPDSIHDGVARFDLGLGDERWQCGVKLGPAYRSDGHPALIVIGSFEIVEPLLRRTARVSSFVALGTAAALAFLSFRPIVPMELEPFEVSGRRLQLAPSRFDGPTGISWYYPQRPILADLNGDGTEDVIGLRWDSGDESRALSVIANEGRTLRPLWRTEPLRSQWNSSRTHLLPSGALMFLTDSEGLVHFYETKTGKSLATPFVSSAHAPCARCPAGPRRSSFRTRTGRERRSKACSSTPAATSARPCDPKAAKTTPRESWAA